MANIISQTKWAEAPEYRNLPAHKQRELYQKYVATAFIDNADTGKDKESIAYRYREFLKNILIYVTQEDTETQRFIANLDVNKKEDVAVVVPFYVRRLKEIALYYASKRKELVDSKHRINKNGSTEGFKRFIKKFLLTLVSDQSFQSRHPKGSIPNFDLIVKNTAINIEQLYDLNTDYHDSIDDDIEGLLYFDEGFKKSIEKVFKNYPLELNTATGVNIRTSKDSRIRINVKRSNYKDLPLRHFFRGDVTLDNIQFNFKKQKYEAYAGSDHYYLSGDGSVGKLFTAKAPHKNLSNQKFPTVASSNKTKTLKKINELGGWFIPSKFGVLALHSKGAKVVYKTSGLKADSIITFPDPSKYGDIKRTGKITFTEDHSWLKAGRGNEYIAGDMYDAGGLYVHKLWPYQSKEETLKFDFQGLSRAEDPVDFWVGDNKTIWGNDDVYTKLPLKPYDTTSKQNDLLVTDKTSYAWFNDSFGNEFALYKETVPTKQNTYQTKGIYKHTPGSRLYRDETDPFNPNYVRDYDHDLFKAPSIKLFEHTYSTAFTEYETTTNNLTADKSIFDKQNLYGKLYFRNAYSSVIAPLEEMYEGLFVKYINDAVIYDELKNKVKDFDVFGDVIVVRTENYLIVEKYFLDPETGYVKAGPTPKIMFKVSSPAYEKISKPWFYEEGNELFVVQTKLHPYVKGSNFKLIYPDITVVNLDNLNITKAFPNSDNIKGDIDTQPFETYNEFANKNISMIGADMSVNFVKIGVPQITFNKGTSTYAITYTAFDEFNYSYLFSIWMKKRESTFFISRSTLLTPDKTVISVDFTNYRELETQIKQFISAKSYSTTKLISDTVLPANDAKHGFMTDTNSLLLAGGSLAGSEVHDVTAQNNSIGGAYASKGDRTTILTVNSGVQGGEKASMIAELGFYKAAPIESGTQATPLSSHGTSMFFYGTYNTDTLNYSNNIIDATAIPEVGYDHRVIMSDDFNDVDEQYINRPDQPDSPIISTMTWFDYGGYPGSGGYKKIVTGDDNASDQNYCLELKTGNRDKDQWTPAVCAFHLTETLVPGRRYRISYKARFVSGPYGQANIQMSIQNGSGDQNNLSTNHFITDTAWKTYTHEAILDTHKRTMYMLQHKHDTIVQFDDFKLEELIPKSQSVVTDNMPDWGNAELFNNTNGFSIIKDKLIGFGLDFSGTKSLIVDDFEQAVYYNVYSNTEEGIRNPWRLTDKHSSGYIDSGMWWRPYQGGYEKDFQWPTGKQHSGSYIHIVNDDANANNQILEVYSGLWKGGGGAMGGSYLSDIPYFEEGKRYKVSLKARLTKGADTVNIFLAQWQPPYAYLEFPLTTQWQTMERKFTVKKDAATGVLYMDIDGLDGGYKDGQPQNSLGVNGKANGAWYLNAWLKDNVGGYARDVTYQIDNFRVEELLDTATTPYKVFNSKGGTIASGTLETLCPEISSRDEIVFNKFKLDLEIEANKLTISTKSSTDTKYIQRAEVDITGALNKYPPMIGAGISNVSHVNTRTNCEVKKLSLTGGKSKPETTIYVDAVRVKQE